MAEETNNTLVLIGAKIRPAVKDVIDQIAREEDRSLSYIVSRLLESHPDVAPLIVRSSLERVGV